jgi:ketosteroid isomerase-like protein
MSTKDGSSELIIRQCVDTFNKCTMEWLDKYYSSDVEWIELPTQAIPQGRRGQIDALRRAAGFALAAFPDRRMEILNIVSNDHIVAVELDWRGTASRQLGNVKEGGTVHLRIASFFEVIDGVITRHTDYCVPAM